MRDAYIPDSVTLRYPDQTAEQVGEDYLLYECRFAYDEIQDQWWLIQTVSVSFLASESNNNLPLIVAGSYASVGKNIRFLHVDTIGELVRLCHRRLTNYIQQQLLDSQLQENQNAYQLR